MSRLFQSMLRQLRSQPNRSKSSRSADRHQSARRNRGRRLQLESLESRRLLAAGNDLASLSDEFDDASSITQWQRVHEVEGWNADQLQSYSIDGATPGAMTMVPNTVVWYQDYRGPMAFREVTGDFVITTDVTIHDRDDVGGADADDVPNDGLFSLGGVMVRTPRAITQPSDWTPGSQADDGTNNGENYVFLSLGHATDDQFSLEVKTTRNSHSLLELAPVGVTANRAKIQIARVNNAILTLVQFPGEEWQVHRRYSRPDMPQTLQVGLVSYTDYGKASEFDPLFHNSNALDGSVNPNPANPFNPDLSASFDYARFVRPDVPETLQGVDLVTNGSDAQLLSFLGGHADTPGDDDLPTVGDQSVIHDQALELMLAETHNGASLSYDIELLGDSLYQLDQQHELQFDGDYHQNWGGRDERWMTGVDGWYYLLPNGDLHRWDGDFESSTLLGELGADVYQDPTQLHDADLPAEVVVDGYALTLTPDAGFVGSFQMLVTVSDGTESASETVTVDVTNQAPVIDAIEQQYMPASQDQLAVEFNAADADADAVTVQAFVQHSEEHQLDQAYGFQTDGQYHDNWGGQSERWIRDQQNDWFYLLPDGGLFEYDGDFDDNHQVAQLSSHVYDDPTLLTDAQATPVDAAVQDGQIIVDPHDGYAGQATIVVAASDGIASTTTEFIVSIENQAPTIEAIDDQTMASGQLQLSVPLTIEDADGDPLQVHVSIVDPAYELDQQRGFFSDGDYHENWGGQQERWIQSVDHGWHYLLPNGDLFAWSGDFATSERLASLGSSYYDDPTRLTEAEPIAATVGFEAGVLTIERDESLTGSVEIRVEASDGFAVVKRTFLVELL